MGHKARMVRPEGFEPPTNGFGSHYSIRLSYERVVSCSPGRRCGPPYVLMAREEHSSGKRGAGLPPVQLPGTATLAAGLGGILCAWLTNVLKPPTVPHRRVGASTGN